MGPYIATFLLAAALLTVCTGCVESTIGTRREAGTLRQTFSPRIKISHVADGAGAITINVGREVGTGIEDTTQGGAELDANSAVSSGADNTTEALKETEQEPEQEPEQQPEQDPGPPQEPEPPKE